MQGAGYDVGSRFARGGFKCGRCHCSLSRFDHRQNGGRAGRTHRDYLKCFSTKSEASINERLEHELETNRRNDEVVRRRQGLRCSCVVDFSV